MSLLNLFIPTHKTRTMFARLFVRSAIMLILSFGAWFLMDLITEQARQSGNDFVTRFPEFLLILRALAIMAWIEVSVLWFRMAIQPKIDIQELALMAVKNNDTRAAVAVYAINIVLMSTRLVIALKLAELL